MMQSMRWQRAGLAAAGSLALVACGGGGGSSDEVPPASALSLSGTAATGRAASGRTVEFKCATGSGSAVTVADGSYSLSITGGVLPCAARVVLADGTALHSAATGTGSSARINLTPATQLAIATLMGIDPAAFFSGFDSAAAALTTPARLSAAQKLVIAALKDAGVDLGAVGDLVSGTLTAGATAGAGNAYDSALDALAARLASSSTTLAELTVAAAANSVDVIAGAKPPSSATPSLPAGQLLLRAAANCKALRSGTYRFIDPHGGAGLADQIGSFRIDAKSLAVVFDDGTSDTWTANGDCRYATDGGATDIVVSPAGVLVARHRPDVGQPQRLAIGFPDQTHTLDELAGTWNIIGMERNAAGTAYTGVAGTGTADANGTTSNVTWCQNDTTWSIADADCGSPTGTPATLRVNAVAGFDHVDAGATAPSGRSFVYRAGNGELAMIKVDGDGSFQLRTRQRTNVLPTVGATNVSWNTYVNNLLRVPQPIEMTSNVIASVDAAAGSWVRTQQTLGLAQSNAHAETVFLNTPRNGYNTRTAGSSTTPGGATVNFNQWTQLTMRGMGFGGLIIPASRTFDVYATPP